VRPNPLLVSTALSLINAEASGKYPWERYLSEGCDKLGIKRPEGRDTDLLFSSQTHMPIPHPVDPWRNRDRPRVFLGPLAAGDVQLRDPRWHPELRTRRVRAIEDDRLGIANPDCLIENRFLVVRGIVDYCDGAPAEGWKEYSAMAAAAYIRVLLEETPNFELPALRHHPRQQGMRPPQVQGPISTALPPPAKANPPIVQPGASGAESGTAVTPVSETEMRKKVFKRLKGITSEIQTSNIMFLVKLPPELRVPGTVAQQIVALQNWAVSPDGCGLEALLKALEDLLGSDEA